MERSPGHHLGGLGRDDLHAGGERLPGCRRPPHQRGELPDGHLLPADVPAADDRDADERSRLQPGVQRLRADGAEADVGQLDAEQQLLLQQHDGELRRLPGQPAEHGGRRDLRGSDQPRARDGHQYDYLTAGSGIGNVYVNAKWLFKASGLYQAPWGINLSAFYNARQGYPQEIPVQTPTRLNGAGQVYALLDPVGDTRLPNFQNVDFHVERWLDAVRIPICTSRSASPSSMIRARRGTHAKYRVTLELVI